jgi:hypothetical protein
MTTLGKVKTSGTICHRAFLHRLTHSETLKRSNRISSWPPAKRTLEVAWCIRGTEWWQVTAIIMQTDVPQGGDNQMHAASSEDHDLKVDLDHEKHHLASKGGDDAAVQSSGSDPTAGPSTSNPTHGTGLAGTPVSVAKSTQRSVRSLRNEQANHRAQTASVHVDDSPTAPSPGSTSRFAWRTVERVRQSIVKFSSFIGPGFVIAVAYSKLLRSALYGLPRPVPRSLTRLLPSKPSESSLQRQY